MRRLPDHRESAAFSEVLETKPKRSPRGSSSVSRRHIWFDDWECPSPSDKSLKNATPVFLCNLKAIPAADRPRYNELIARVRAAVRERTATPSNSTAPSRRAVRETIRNAAQHGDDPGKVAQVILKIARAPFPRLRYLAGQERWLPYAKVLLPQRLLEYAVRRGFGLRANAAEYMGDPAAGQ